MRLKPIVFVAVGDKSTVVLTPNSTHTLESWKKVEEEICSRYIEECIRGHPARCRGVSVVLEFFGRHPEWDYTFFEGTALYNHTFVE